MNTTQFSTQLYVWLIRLYPKNFRQEFGDEMQWVFAQAVKQCPPRSLITLWWRELIHLPVALGEQYFYVLQQTLKEGKLAMKVFSSRNVFFISLFITILAVFVCGTMSLSALENNGTLNGIINNTLMSSNTMMDGNLMFWMMTPWMILGWALVIGVIAGVIFALSLSVRYLRPESPLMILQRRYARGEITTDQFELMLAQLSQR